MLPAGRPSPSGRSLISRWPWAAGARQVQRTTKEQRASACIVSVSTLPHHWATITPHANREGLLRQARHAGQDLRVPSTQSPLPRCKLGWMLGSNALPAARGHRARSCTADGQACQALAQILEHRGSAGSLGTLLSREWLARGRAVRRQSCSAQCRWQSCQAAELLSTVCWVQEPLGQALQQQARRSAAQARRH